VEQVELPENVRTRFQVETRAIHPIAQAERIIAEMPNPPAIEYHGSLAFYRPSTDTVVLPPRDTFVSPQGFYESIFHELLHSTGHPRGSHGPASANRFTSVRSGTAARS
jgi:antirestriction protein ArdC